jgi:hypothetical protein
LYSILQGKLDSFYPIPDFLAQTGKPTSCFQIKQSMQYYWVRSSIPLCGMIFAIGKS